MLHPSLLAKKPAPCRTIHLVTEESLPQVLKKLTAAGRGYVTATGFAPQPGRIALVPDTKGAIADVLFGIEPGANPDPFVCGRLPAALPAGAYAFAEAPPQAELATLAFAMAAYRFAKYKAGETSQAQLVVPAGVDADRVSRLALAVAKGRDLINTPANDLGPDALAREATLIAERYGAVVKEIAGKKLLKKDFPLIHAVGRASTEEPRLVAFTWGDAAHPKVTLVGKGVCFDTGGLDIKPSSAMLMMKKDMGGAPPHWPPPK